MKNENEKLLFKQSQWYNNKKYDIKNLSKDFLFSHIIITAQVYEYNHQKKRVVHTAIIGGYRNILIDYCFWSSNWESNSMYWTAISLAPLMGEPHLKNLE